MAVKIEGYGDLTMPKDLLDHLRMYVLREEQRRTTVPEVVKPHRRQSCLLQHGVEAPDHVAFLKPGSNCRAENETMILPA